MFVTKQISSPIGKNKTIVVNGVVVVVVYKHSFKYLPLGTAEQRHLYRFGTT